MAMHHPCAALAVCHASPSHRLRRVVGGASPASPTRATQPNVAVHHLRRRRVGGLRLQRPGQRADPHARARLDRRARAVVPRRLHRARLQPKPGADVPGPARPAHGLRPQRARRSGRRQQRRRGAHARRHHDLRAHERRGLPRRLLRQVAPGHRARCRQRQHADHPRQPPPAARHRLLPGPHLRLAHLLHRADLSVRPAHPRADPRPRHQPRHRCQPSRTTTPPTPT
jgi:hypothetical protein